MLSGRVGSTNAFTPPPRYDILYVASERGPVRERKREREKEREPSSIPNEGAGVAVEVFVHTRTGDKLTLLLWLRVTFVPGPAGTSCPGFNKMPPTSTARQFRPMYLMRQ